MTVERIHPKAPVMLIFIAIFTCLPSCINLSNTSKVNLKYNAEFLAIELVLENENKIIVATCYRVGTLGIDNCREVAKEINTLLRKKRVKKILSYWGF